MLEDQTSLQHYYPSLGLATPPQAQLTNAGEQIVKRVKTTADPAVQNNGMNFSRKTPKKDMAGKVSQLAPPHIIEISPPNSPNATQPDPLLIREQETSEFKKAIACFQEGEYGSDYEDRVCNLEYAFERFSQIAKSGHAYRQEAEYFQCMSQMILAANHMDSVLRLEQLKFALKLLQKIQDPAHPFYLDVKDWEEECQLQISVIERNSK